MSEKVSFGLKIPRADREFVNQILEDFRDKENGETKSIAFVRFFKEYEKQSFEPTIITPEEKEELQTLKELCDRGLLSIIGDTPVCGQKIGIDSIRPFVYPKDHPQSGQRMRLEDIIVSCNICKQRFTEDKRISALMDRMKIILNTNQEITFYRCIHPTLNDILLTAFKDAIWYCGTLKRNIRLDRNCIKKDCEFLNLNVFKIPPPEPYQEKGGDKD